MGPQKMEKYIDFGSYNRVTVEVADEVLTGNTNSYKAVAAHMTQTVKGNNLENMLVSFVDPSFSPSCTIHYMFLDTLSEKYKRMCLRGCVCVCVCVHGIWVKQVCMKSTIPGLKQIASGAFHAAALTEDGKVLVWGKGSLGRLGSLLFPLCKHAHLLFFMHGPARREGAAVSRAFLLYSKQRAVQRLISVMPPGSETNWTSWSPPLLS